MERGIIKTITTAKNGNKYGYITPDNKIPDYDKDVIFFEDNLKDISFDSLEKDIKVEFNLEPYNDLYIARDINLVADKLAEATIKPIPITLNRHVQSIKKGKRNKPINLISIYFVAIACSTTHS